MNEFNNDVMRQLVEKAVTIGRSLQSSQTGYLHYFYGSEEEPFLTIPLVENALFALALFRTRIAENAIEAKNMLNRLLHFQHQDGNFPIYLHEFPECKNRLSAVHFSIPLFWILRNHHLVLGADLKKKIEESLLKALECSLKVMEEQELPYHLSLKIAALQKAGGTLLGQSAIEAKGQAKLDELLALKNPSAWYSPAQMGNILTALQMVFPRLDNSPWCSFWKHFETTCHRETQTYTGPSIKEFQDAFEPQVTLYDLYLSYFLGKFSARSRKERAVHLEGALIQHSEDVFKELSYPIDLKRLAVEETTGHLFNSKSYGYSYIEKGNFFHQSLEKGFHLFRFVRGTEERVHTLVCQDGNFKKTELVETQDGLEILFHLDEPINVEDREKSRDIVFYFDFDDQTEITISGDKATTFALGEEIGIKDKQFSFSMIFTLEDGEGRFLGHLMRGNRPSQVNLKGNRRFNSYDWQLFLRALQRKGNVKIRVRLNWGNVNDVV